MPLHTNKRNTKGMSWQQRYRREVISGCKKELIKVESSSKRFWLLKHSRKSHTIQRVAVTNFRALDRHLNLGFPKSRPWDKKTCIQFIWEVIKGSDPFSLLGHLQCQLHPPMGSKKASQIPESHFHTRYRRNIKFSGFSYGQKKPHISF